MTGYFAGSAPAELSPADHFTEGIFTPLIIRRTICTALVAGGITLGLAVGEIDPHTSALADPPPPAHHHGEEDIAGEIHSGFADMFSQLDITDEQKPKMDAIEKKVVDAVKADHSKMRDKAFQASFMADIRAELTPDQQKKWDHRINQDKMASTGSDIHSIGLAVLMYETEHDKKTPPDLGSLIGEDMLSPGVFLTGWSTTKPPADWKTMDAKAKADWVNQNAELVYVGAGKKADDLSPSFVLAYIKPEAALEGMNAFLMSDLSVQQKPADEAKAIIDELTAGKNPPPSYKETPVMLPPHR
jgi:hypothetical protein